LVSEHSTGHVIGARAANAIKRRRGRARTLCRPKYCDTVQRLRVSSGLTHLAQRHPALVLWAHTARAHNRADALPALLGLRVQHEPCAARNASEARATRGARRPLAVLVGGHAGFTALVRRVVFRGHTVA
jgi:hypothetical protein